ncbi:permease [Clostridiaceae bacterium NSJ-31]|uniref:Permease n=1 Tax=Ligaoa zhengdingensis TaxID=2763658 RepID=A0A926E0Q6_9FIRM|nr:permease [Ligaoa zhengdingensis]MBC8547646.1 permease [Ligaoa zhengdingensis]
MNLSLLPLHQHDSALDGMLEHGLESIGLSHEWTEFFLHFIADTVSLFLILFVVMFAVSLLQTYIPFEKLKSRMAGLGSVWGYLLAMALGVVSPFCSCTVIPVVMGLCSMGVPVAVALCYLTSAALLNGGAVAALFAALGPRFGAVYVAVSVLMAVGVSLLMRPFAGADVVVSYEVGGHHHHGHHHDGDCGDCCQHEPKSRLGYCLENVGHVLSQTWVYMILSVALSAAVLSFVPMDTLERLIGGQNWFSLLLAGVLGAPIHGDAFAILPLLQLLEPISFPVTLTFALAVMGVSIPEVMLLGRVFKAKTVAAYAGWITAFSILAGALAILMI